MKKRLWIALICIVVFVVGVGIYRKTRKAPEPLPEPEVVEEEEVISASGSIRAQQAVTLTFPTSGKLVWLPIKEGDTIKKGQAIAKLDTYEQERDLKNLLVAYNKERNDFEEDRKTTYKTENILDARNDTIKRILEKNQWDLEKAVNDVEIQNYALKLATLISPINGVVIKATPSVTGINVTPTSSSFIIADPLSVMFVAEIDEVDIASMNAGLKATITLDAFIDTPIETSVERLGYTSIITDSGSTAYEAFLPLPEMENITYRIGMNGDVEFER